MVLAAFRDVSLKADPGTPTEATTTTYYQSGTSCGALSSGSNVNNKPCEISTTLNGSKVADAKYAYDSQGNLLTTSVWNGSAWIGQTTPNTYNSNGTIATTYDVANNATTYSYNSSGYVSCESCTNFPFPTSITKGGLTSSSTWNGVGGVKLSNTDPNGKTTNYGYTSSGGTADPFWRLSSVTDPLQNEVWKTYPTGSSPDTANSSFTFGLSIQNVTATTDGYGRTINVQREQGPSSTNYDTTTTLYTWADNYRKVQTTRPCTATSGSQCSFSFGVTTALLDPLGRPYAVTDGGGGTVTHTYSNNGTSSYYDLYALTPAPAGETQTGKRTQVGYNGVGWVTSVCHIGSTASTGSGTACPSTSYNGAVDAYTYTQGTGYTEVFVTRAGSQQHTKLYDALGRVTSVTTPEGGTALNTYDTVPSYCSGNASAYPGKLIGSAYANGNEACYQYDALGRTTVITGMNGSSVACRRFYYDNSTGALGAIPTGITISNPSGRMVEAETDNCTSPITSSTMITDEWFSYDADGHTTDMWELTPNSGQY
jgi:YD repeat-containing protein